MKYQLKISGAIEESGTIDLQRLATISNGIRKISEGALQIRLKGISFSRGKKKIPLEQSLKVRLTGLKEGSTILSLEAEPFIKTLEPIQMDLFRQEAQQDLPEQTPVSLFIKTFQDALDNNKSKELLDKPLLRELKAFKKAFLKDDEELSFLNQGTVPELKLKKHDFDKIKILEDEIPEPEAVLINGIVEELKYSKLKVKIKTEEGIVDGFLAGDLSTEDIAKYWGKEVTISGTVHYKPGGKSVIEINSIFEPGEGDQYFSKKPKAETIEQQIERQLIEKGYKNQLAEIVGKWPGDEDFEDLLNMLTK